MCKKLSIKAGLGAILLAFAVLLLPNYVRAADSLDVCIWDYNDACEPFAYQPYCLCDHGYESPGSDRTAIVNIVEATSIYSIEFRLYYTTCEVGGNWEFRLNDAVIGTAENLDNGYCNCSPQESTWPHAVTLNDAAALNAAWNFGAPNDLTVAFVGHDNDIPAWFEATIGYETSVHACFTPNLQSVALGELALFDASCSSVEEGRSIAGYSWDFGDGATSTGVSPSHVYASEGCFDVTLAVTDDFGRVGNALGTVCALGEVPVADANGPYTGGQCLPVVFDGSGSFDTEGIVRYEWDFGDGNSGEGITPTHTYTGGDEYTVFLTIYDAAGQSDTASTTVSLSNLPPTVITVPWLEGSASVAHPIMSGTETTLKGTVKDCDPVSFEWEFGDGSTPVSGAVSDPYVLEAHHTYTGSIGALYFATLTVADSLGQSASDTYLVEIVANDLSNQVNVAIDEGLWYLHRTMIRYGENGEELGKWFDYDNSYNVAHSGAAAHAFEDKGYLPDGDPMESPYVETVRRALNDCISRMYPIYDTHGFDLNGNGVVIGCMDGHPVYEPGIVMMAIVASDNPYRVATVGDPTYVRGRTYEDLMEDMVEYLAYAQNDDPPTNSGWRYRPNDTSSDNSVTQWPVLGLRAAEEWNLYAPDSVKELLAQWYDYSQADDGSFGYTMPYEWNNISKTGAGILGLFYCGQNPSSESVVDAFNYIDTHWATDGEFWDNYPDGHYIMYGFYSAFKACMSWCPLIERIGDHDWYTEMAQNLVAYQNQSGSARGSWSAHMWESDNLATSWALQILAKALHVRYPVADAGGPYDSDTTTAVNLSGCGSYHNDPYRDIVLFEWDFEDDGVYDYSSVTCTATHTYPIEGTYTVRLRVADDSYPCILADTDTAQVTISTAAHNPVAVCGGPYLGWIGVSVTFDGSGSYDIDVGDSIVGWEWDIDNDGQFDDASGSIVTNTWNSTYEGVVGLRVTDTTARIGACWTTVTIGNHAPVAESGGPYVGCQNRMLILEGNDSYDPDEPAGDSIVSWMWDLDGDRLFDDALGEIAEISVDVFWPTPGVRDIGLRVTDSYGRFHDDWTSVDVQEEAECNEPPVANAGPDQETCMGDTVQLDGSGSHDADGDPLTCFWSILSAPACSSAILSDPAAMRPTLEPDCEGDFACQLIVNDYMSDSEPDTVMVSVSECGAYVCPVSHGYWKNHLEDWPVSSLVLGDETYTQAELAAILAKARNNDASSILGMQFVAAKLNIANGSDPAPISDTIELADELLSAYSGKLPYRVPPSAADGRAMVEYAEELDRYNNGSATPDCELW